MRIRDYKRGNSMVLVLNSDYLPINITTFRKGFKLLYKGKAVVIDEENYDMRSNKPLIIRLVKYATIPFRKVVLSRENIFKRDEHICAYCSSKHNLTVDHIFPKSKGGKNSWENLITCCFDCNCKKGDRTLEQADMKLLYQPFRPNPLYFMYKSNKHENKWQPYLMFG